jgi:hypothetical protein
MRLFASWEHDPAPSNKRLQLALQPYRAKCLFPVVSAEAVGVAGSEIKSFDQLRRSFRRGAAETLIR